MAVGKLLVCFLVLLFAVVHRAWRIGVDAIQLDDSIVGYSPEDSNSEECLVDLFQSWMRKHEKSYESVSQMNQRFAIFKDNLRYIHLHNVQDSTPCYSLGLNNLADLTHEEFKDSVFGYQAAAPQRKKVADDPEFHIRGVAGHPQPLDLLKVSTLFVQASWLHCRSNNCWTVTRSPKMVATVVSRIMHLSTS
ncbi:unnamed protein product [Sphagnum tenellum]